jgi:hypothetical protein
MEQVEGGVVAAGIAAGAGKAGQHSATGDHGGGNCPRTESEENLDSRRLGIIKYPNNQHSLCFFPFLCLPSSFFFFFSLVHCTLSFVVFFFKSFCSVIMIGKQHQITSY